MFGRRNRLQRVGSCWMLVSGAGNLTCITQQVSRHFRSFPLLSRQRRGSVGTLACRLAITTILCLDQYSARVCLTQLHIAIVLNLSFDPYRTSPAHYLQVRARAKSCTAAQGSAEFPVTNSLERIKPAISQNNLRHTAALSCNRHRNYHICTQSYMD